MAIKTFEQFTQRGIYTENEYNTAYAILSDFYEDDDLEDFILNGDTEEKEEFIEDNDIQTLRVCQHCGKFMNEGYLYKDFETFCSDECFIKEYGKSQFENADDDVLYWTAWEG